MTWLVQEIWLWMALAGLAGAVLTAFFSTTEIKSERWVPTPEVEEPIADESAEVPAPVVRSGVEDQAVGSPFPDLQPVSAARPWAEEELWSRPLGTETTAAGWTEPAADEWGTDADDWADDWAGWGTAS